MRTPQGLTKKEKSEEAFISGGSADQAFKETEPKSKKEAYKTYSFTLPAGSLESIKRTQLRLMQAGYDNPNRSDIVRAALSYIESASDKELAELVATAKA